MRVARGAIPLRARSSEKRHPERRRDITQSVTALDDVDVLPVLGDDLAPLHRSNPRAATPRGNRYCQDLTGVDERAATNIVGRRQSGDRRSVAIRDTGQGVTPAHHMRPEANALVFRDRGEGRLERFRATLWNPDRIVVAVERRHPAPELGIQELHVVQAHAGRVGCRRQIDRVIEANDVVVDRRLRRRCETVSFWVFRNDGGRDDERHVASGLPR